MRGNKCSERSRTVELFGAVIRATLKTRAERKVKNIEGVESLKSFPIANG